MQGVRARSFIIVISCSLLISTPSLTGFAYLQSIMTSSVLLPLYHQNTAMTVWYDLAFASGNNEDQPGSSNEEDNEDQPGSSNEEDNEDQPGSSNEEDNEGDRGLTSDSSSSNNDIGNGTTGDVGRSPDPALTTYPSGNTGDVSGLGGDDTSANDGSSSSRTFTHNAEKIASQLVAMTPVEVSQYPINALSTEDIRLVLGFLDPVNLAKVLLNISPQDLQNIQSRLSGDNSFENVLSVLSI